MALGSSFVHAYVRRSDSMEGWEYLRSAAFNVLRSHAVPQHVMQINNAIDVGSKKSDESKHCRHS
jgi:hypothetical protein